MKLDTFCHTLTDLYIVLAAHILLNISCKIITSNTNRVVTYDTS